MTTIAYRDGVLACDSLITHDCWDCGLTRKIVKSAGGLIGGASSTLPDVALFLEWVEKDLGGDVPNFSDEAFDGLIVFPSGRTCYVGKSGILVPFEAPFVALGHGAPCALGAMEMRATATEAVQAAIKHNTSTGGPIRFVMLGEDP